MGVCRRSSFKFFTDIDWAVLCTTAAPGPTFDGSLGVTAARASQAPQRPRISTFHPSGRLVGFFKSIFLAPAGILKFFPFPHGKLNFLDLPLNGIAEAAAIKAKGIKQRILSVDGVVLTREVNYN